MADNYSEEFEALAAHFNTGWASATPVCWPNIKFTSPDGDPWVKFDVVTGESFQASIGQATNVYRHVGRVMVNIYSPENKGMASVLALADSVAAIFRSSVVDLNIIFKSPEVRERGVEDGVLKVHVSIPFTRDTLI